jgi:hypothetical protein
MEHQEKAARFCLLVNKLEDKYRKEEEMITTTFREAWDHPLILTSKVNAIRLKFSQMIRNMVWK